MYGDGDGGSCSVDGTTDDEDDDDNDDVQHDVKDDPIVHSGQDQAKPQMSGMRSPPPQRNQGRDAKGTG